MSIEEISESVGFESSAYFRRVFKKLTMKNPRDYKKTSMEM
jgi:YesN/AraC family two-component response regulator